MESLAPHHPRCDSLVSPSFDCNCEVWWEYDRLTELDEPTSYNYYWNDDGE